MFQAPNGANCKASIQFSPKGYHAAWSGLSELAHSADQSTKETVGGNHTKAVAT